MRCQRSSKASPGARMLIATGVLVRVFAVYGLLVDDDTVELIGVELEPS